RLFLCVVLFRRIPVALHRENTVNLIRRAVDGTKSCPRAARQVSCRKALVKQATGTVRARSNSNGGHTDGLRDPDSRLFPYPASPLPVLSTSRHTVHSSSTVCPARHQIIRASALPVVAATAVAESLPARLH